MKRKRNIDVPEGNVQNLQIQPSHNLTGQPAQVVQDGWIAYLPSMQHAKPSFSNEGRGFFKGNGRSIHGR